MDELMHSISASGPLVEEAATRLANAYNEWKTPDKHVTWTSTHIITEQDHLTRATIFIRYQQLEPVDGLQATRSSRTLPAPTNNAGFYRSRMN